MKSKKRLLVFLIVLCMILTACGGGSSEPPAEPDPEIALNNFFARLEDGNYVMNAGEYLKTSVSSADQVTFEYVDDAYNDFAVMSVDDEVFQGFIKGDTLTDIRFLGEGRAIEAAKKRLPNYWADESVSEGNIWNLFYNTPEEPLKFLSNSDVVKQSVLGFAGYNETALRLMHDVYLVLDKEDPTTAHIQAEMDEDVVARISYDDIDLEITFGNAESTPIADAWMSSPVYPEARTAWDEVDEFVFNSVFLPGYGLESVPFPSFASYALTVDQESFVIDDAVYIRDSHATEEDVNGYIAALEQNGFSEVKETAADGTEKTFYRKLLREAYNCYASLEVEYNDGFDLTAEKYYDCPTYDGLDAVNAAIAPFGFPALPESDNFTACMGTDRADASTESWLYFFTYDMMLYVDIDYEDQEALMAYLKDYEQAVTDAGFTASAAGEDPEESEEYELEMGEPLLGGGLGIEMDSDRYVSPNGFYDFRYHFAEDGRVILLFKAEKYISPDEAEQMIADAGFPAIELTEPISVRDLKLFRKTQLGKDQRAYITVTQEFETAEEGEAFLAAYEALLNEAGFDRTDPSKLGSLKEIAIYNEETGMYVALDFIPSEPGVYFEFCAE